MGSKPSNRSERLIQHAIEIVAAYLTRNHVRASEVPGLIVTMHRVLGQLGTVAENVLPHVDKPTPAQIRKSITPDALRSFEDDRTYKTLKRHLTTRGLTPDTYRVKWGLPFDYPMTAPNYSEMRSALARGTKFGHTKHSSRKLNRGFTENNVGQKRASHPNQRTPRGSVPVL